MEYCISVYLQTIYTSENFVSFRIDVIVLTDEFNSNHIGTDFMPDNSFMVVLLLVQSDAFLSVIVLHSIF